MATTLTPTAGSTVAVSAAAPATFDTTGYGALTFTTVNGFDTIGAIGDGYEVQNFDSITDGRIPYRGIRDGGSIEANMADMPADAGQVILKAAFDAAKGSAGEKISVKITDPNSKETYAQVIVSEWRRNYGGANDVIRRQATLVTIPGTIVEDNT